MLSYCANEVYKYDRDAFMASLFVPPAEREALLAVYALNVELANIPKLVTEEMIGHIRLAWWQEAIDELYLGHAPRGQPVLQELAAIIQAGKLPQEKLAPLMDAWREHYPDMPPQLNDVLEHIAEYVVPDATGMNKARGVIARHRKRYGQRLNGWLSLKLLLAGL